MIDNYPLLNYRFELSNRPPMLYTGIVLDKLIDELYFRDMLYGMAGVDW